MPHLDGMPAGRVRTTSEHCFLVLTQSLPRHSGAVLYLRCALFRFAVRSSAGDWTLPDSQRLAESRLASHPSLTHLRSRNPARSMPPRPPQPSSHAAVTFRQVRRPSAARVRQTDSVCPARPFPECQNSAGSITLADAASRPGWIKRLGCVVGVADKLSISAARSVRRRGRPPNTAPFYQFVQGNAGGWDQSVGGRTAPGRAAAGTA